MNEQQRLLAETVDGLFPELAGSLRGHGASGSREAAWAQVAELGIPDVLLPEEAGGFGGGWQDARVVLHAIGAHALPLPLAETLLARTLLHGTAITAPAGPVTVARASCAGNGNDLRLALQRVPWGEGDVPVLTAFASEGQEWLALLDPSKALARTPRESVSSEPRCDLLLDAGAIVARSPRANACRELLERGALLRAVQAGGALQGALSLTVAHVNERVQFGRALAKFQAVQHQLALLAEEAAAVGCAAAAACAALDRGEAGFAIACAKLRANRAAHPATSIAHQMHGAIGFTREHALHHYTQRLWSWRSDFGNDSLWARQLGALAAQAGAAGLWSRITA